ncbi:nicotinate-nucleotide adenylyltransferase [Devosia rhodophyticola]|uniref:Probable nicotinate-nucleotide adenylyltransferase n=1 Tax=Devosia rhodophyticola TaxID=3026423 RepID=A0ABY7YU03_9HYPH|nr:nicotinate-nucleotide adenylyltransferase [Devosia rhodophyticola]WDR04729.1 nicotinate-nucleotide adenylyltransferase [Devosia rhodophyticola]
MNQRLAPVHLNGITQLPPSGAGMRIGLFGGSFNPAHSGHLLVAEQALIRLGLDALWVLVTPGNPLKNHADLAPLAQRVDGARKVMTHPKIKVTGFEAAKGFTYSYQTIRFLTQTLPDRHFVWIMGADNMVGFHHWQRWRDIANMVPVAIYVRPGSARLAPASRAAEALERYRIDETDATALALQKSPAWVYLHGRQSNLSSSAIRARRHATATK